jgi:hypothetical protein
VSAAVATKPRAKSAKKAAPAPTRTPLEAVKFELASAIHILEGVLGVADYGGAMYALVLLAVEEKLPRAMRHFQHTPFAKEDIWEVYEELFPVLHLLDGAIALAPGEANGIFEAPLVAARQIINQAHNKLDCVGAIARGLPDIDAKARDFMRGKALLAEMLRRAIGAECGGASSMFARNRSDDAKTEQVNFVKGDLLGMVEDPSLVDGYSAALCEVLSEAMLDGVTPEAIVEAPYEACLPNGGAA